MNNIMHHACLKDILEKLIVVNGPTRLDFKYPALTWRMGVGVEAFQYFALAAKKDGNNNLVLNGLPLLNPESKLFQSWAKPSHHRVAMLTHRCARIDSVAHFFEERDNKKTEFWRR
jgi:hypothetical protein